MSNKPFVAQFGLISGNTYFRSTSGKASVNSASEPSNNFEIAGADGILVPIGNTAQRPAGANGLIRYNTDTAGFEGYTGGAWGPIGGVDSGGDVTNVYLQSTFLKLSGGTLTGNILPNSNTTNLGNTDARWVLVANSGNFSGFVTTSTGFYPTSNSSGAALGANDRRFAVFANAIVTSGGITPNSNTSGDALGNTTSRFTIFSQLINTSGGVFPVSNTVGTSLGSTTQQFNIFANSITLASSFNPVSNSTGTELGSTTQRWNITGNSATFSGTLSASGLVTVSSGIQPASNTSGQILGAAAARFHLHANSIIVSDSVVPLSNATGTGLGASTARWNMQANSITVSGTLAPFSNTVGFTLGDSNARWSVVANTGDFSSTLTVAGTTTLNGMLQTSGSVNFTRTLLTGSFLSSNTDAGAMTLHGNSTTGAYGSLHRAGAYSTRFGLDTDNQFTVGGWSAGSGMARAKFGGLGVGVAAQGAGTIHATGDIHTAYSDERLKENIEVISGALSKVMALRGVHYNPNHLSEEFGIGKRQTRRVGVIAQDVQKVLPEVISIAPFDINEKGESKSGENYMTVMYDRLIPLLIEAIKELSREVEELKRKE